MKSKSNPGLFISLLGASFILLILVTFIFTYFSTTGYLLMIIVGTIATLGLLTLIVLFLSLRQGKPILGLDRLISWVLNTLFPSVLSLGSLLGIKKDKIRASFINLHNSLTKMKPVTAKPEQILLLLPHCIQLADCKFKVTTDVNNCRRCGRCVIHKLLALKDKYGFKMEIATGGTIARRKIETIRPKVVIAVACERDLASGISDVEQIYVLGITNERPFGPCYNTTVSVEEVENLIKQVL